MKYPPTFIRGIQIFRPLCFISKQNDFCQNSMRYVVAIILLSAVAISFWFPAALYAQAAPDSHGTCESEQPIMDLTRDDDANGIPNALEESLACIERVVNGATRPIHASDVNCSDAVDDVIQNVIADEYNRLPYSTEVHTLQQELGELNQRLAETETVEAAERIYAEIAQLTEQLQTDPTYALVNDSFEALLLAEIEAEIATAGERPVEQIPSTHRLYIPLVTNSANLDQVTSIQAASTEQLHTAPDYTRLTRGDIMFMRGSSNIAPMLYAVVFGHTVAMMVVI